MSGNSIALALGMVVSVAAMIVIASFDVDGLLDRLTGSSAFPAAIDIARQRLNRGEIDQAQFDEIAQTLGADN